MKKYILVLLALTLVLCAGCGQQVPAQTQEPATDPVQTEQTTVPAETTVPPTTEAPIPVPELSVGYARVDKTPAVLETLLRDDVVDVVGEYDEDHYVVKTDLGYGLVKKVMLRLDGENPYEAWTGYAYSNAAVYDNFYLSGEPVLTLKLNTKVEVLDDLGWCCVVRVEDVMGFMVQKNLAKQLITYSDSSGKDGGDISLRAQGGVSLLAAIEQKGDVTGQAVVLADGAEVVAGYFTRGEELPLVAEEGFAENREGFVTVYLDGLYAYVPQMLVLPEGEEVYAAWDGFSRRNGAVYDNFHLLGEPVTVLNVNAQIHVLEELDNCYLVEVNGATGYMSKDMVSATKIPTGGNSGGEWTPPVL